MPTMPTFKCPRCAASAEQRFYGPCSECVDELRQLKAPAPDPHFVAVKRMDGAHAIAYVGPRVERQTP